MTEIYIPSTPLIIAKDNNNQGNFYANNITDRIVTTTGSVINPFNDLNLYGGRTNKKDIEIFYKNKDPVADVSYNEIAFTDPSLTYVMTVGDNDMIVKKSDIIIVTGGGGGGTYNGETIFLKGVNSDLVFFAKKTYTINLGIGGRGGIGITDPSINNGTSTSIIGNVGYIDSKTNNIADLGNIVIRGGMGGNNRKSDDRLSDFVFNGKTYGRGGDKMTFINGLTYYLSEGYIDPDPSVTKNQKFGYITDITDNSSPLNNIFRPMRCNYYWWWPYEPWKYNCVNPNRPFSMFFTGYFYAKTGGNYTFATFSDDDSWIFINFIDKNMKYTGKGNFYASGYYHNRYGRKVAENGGLHGNRRSYDVGPEPAGNGLPAGSITLESNTVYRITMIYKQNYGGANFSAYFRIPEGVWRTNGTGYYYSDKPGQNDISSLSKLNGGNGFLYIKYNIKKSAVSNVNNVNITKEITQNFGADSLVVKPVLDIPITDEKEAKKKIIEDMKKSCKENLDNKNCDDINISMLESFGSPDLLSINDPYTGDIINMINEFESPQYDTHNYTMTKISYYSSQDGVITLYKLTLMTLLLNEIYYNFKSIISEYLSNNNATININYNLINSIKLCFNKNDSTMGSFTITNNLATVVINLKNNYDYLFFKTNTTTNEIVNSTTTAFESNDSPTFTNIASAKIPYSYTFNYFKQGFYNFSSLKSKGFVKKLTDDSFGYGLNKQFYNYMLYKLYYIFNLKDNLLSGQIINLYHNTNILIYKLKLYYAINIYSGTVTDITLNRMKDKLYKYVNSIGAGNLLPYGASLNKYSATLSHSNNKPYIEVANLKTEYDKKSNIVEAKASAINDNRTKLNSVINQYNNDKSNINSYTTFSYMLYTLMIFLIVIFAVIVMSPSITEGSKIIYSFLIFVFIFFMLVITYIYYGNSSLNIEKFTSANTDKSYLYDIAPCAKFIPNDNTKDVWNPYDINNFTNTSACAIDNKISSSTFLRTSPCLSTSNAAAVGDAANMLSTNTNSAASIISTTKNNKLCNYNINNSSNGGSEFVNILYNYSITNLNNSSFIVMIRDKYIYDIFLLDNGNTSNANYINDDKNKYCTINVGGPGTSTSSCDVVLQFKKSYDNYIINHTVNKLDINLGLFMNDFNTIVTSYLFSLQLNVSFLDSVQLYRKTNDALAIKQKNVDNYYKIYQNKKEMVKTNQNLLKYDMIYKYNLNNSLCYIFMLSILIYVLYLLYPHFYNILLIIWCILLVVIILIFLMSITFPVRTKTSKSYWLKPSKDTISQL